LETIGKTPRTEMLT